MPVDPNQSRVWGVRAAAILSVLAIAAPLLVSLAFGPRNLCEESSIRPPDDYWPFLPLALPFLAILGELRVARIKKGLAIALAVGCAAFMLTLLAIFIAMPDLSRPFLVWSVVFVLVQVAMVTLAIRTYYALPHEAGDPRTLLMGILRFGAYAGTAVILATFFLPNLTNPRRNAAEASPVGSLRSINTAEITYASTYTKGFSASLEALGPPHANTAPTENAADLIDEWLARGHKLGYEFSYHPGPPDAGGTISTYALTARPVEFGRSGCRNFFTDQSEVIRSIKEDRSANAHDSPLE